MTSRTVGDSYICRRKRTIGQDKPKSVITLNSQHKLMLSKAFSASSDTISTSWSVYDLAYSSAIKTLCMFRVADRPGTKPEWAGCNREGSRGAKRDAIILDRILTSTLITEIGGR